MKQWLSAPLLHFPGKFPMRLPCLTINAIIVVDVNGGISNASVSTHAGICEDGVTNTGLVI